MSDGVAAADARPLRTVRRAILRTALVGALVVPLAALLSAGQVALALLAAVATVVGSCTFVEGWARGRAYLPGAFVALAAALLVPAAVLQLFYALAVLDGAAPEAALAQALARGPEPLGLAALGCLGSLVLGLAVRIRHGVSETHGEVFKTLAALSLGFVCMAPVALLVTAGAVWGLAALWRLADRAEARVWPLVDRDLVADLRIRMTGGRISLGRVRAAAWAGDPAARAVLGAGSPSPPDELRSWVRGLATFEAGALRAAALALQALASEELAARRERGPPPDPCGARLEQAVDEAARAVGDGAGGSSPGGSSGVGPLDDAAVRAGWAAAFAADALGEGPVRAAVREAVTAWALDERPG